MRVFFRGSASVLVCVAATLLMAAPDGRAQALDDDPALDRIVALVTERLDTADAVAAAKWATAAQNGGEPSIDDPVREAQVYDAMGRLGADRGLPESWIHQVFYGQIEANKIVQRGLVGRWRFDPAAVPSTPPDLASVRPVIDRVNVEILDQLALRRAELTGPNCAERLVPPVFGMLGSGRDALHQAALVRAAAALCGP
ncbi:gamma subclass chorismate mutase AroQ [Nocardia anaemiae]|uniref:gamma subclass chorismate mutase AroQ n=1 Tax=Nocardia anaemiae TaxID=263910 RepID=UPI001C3FDBA9|nr:gamma subclass chorismate mutase AroQ [Nocardia anaemiae]